MRACNLPGCPLPAEWDATLANGGRFFLCKLHRDECRESGNLKTSSRLRWRPQFTLRSLFLLVLFACAASTVAGVAIRSGRPLRTQPPKQGASEDEIADRWARAQERLEREERQREIVKQVFGRR